MPSKRDCWLASAPAILALLLLCSVPPRSAATAAQTELRGDISRDGFALVRRALSRDAAAALRAPVLAAIAAEAAVCSKCSPADLASVDNAECFSCDHSWRDGGDGSGPRAFVRARRLEVREPIQLGAPLVFNRDLARLAATALGANAVRLYQATAFVKSAGDGPTPWHADSIAAPFEDGNSMITLWLALDDVPAECGALRFLRGSHSSTTDGPSLWRVKLARRLRAWNNFARNGALSDGGLTHASGLDIVEPTGLQAGDATLHLGWSLHAAKGHECASPRIAVAVSYVVDGARIHRELFAPPREGRGTQQQLSTRSLVASTPTSGPDAGFVRLAHRDTNETALVVRLLADDASTWVPWLLEKPPALIPGRSPSGRLSPLLYSKDSSEL